MNSIPQYRIAWKSKVSEARGHGDWIFEYKNAKSAFKSADKKYGDRITHWIEEKSLDTP